MYSLLVDGSQNTLKWAILKEQAFFFSESLEQVKYEWLLPHFRQTLSEKGVPLSEVKRWAVVTGPGSYVGLRSTLLMARTWAQMTNGPVWGAAHWDLAFLNQSSSSHQVYLQAIKQTHVLWRETGGDSPILLTHAELEERLAFASSAHYLTSSETLAIQYPSAEIELIPHDLSRLANWMATKPSVEWEHLHPIYARPATLALPKPLPA